MKFLEQYTDVTYALLRIVAGAIFTFHGVQKIFGVLTEHQPVVVVILPIGELHFGLVGLMSAQQSHSLGVQVDRASETVLRRSNERL